MNKVPRFVWTLLLCLICIVVTAACCLLIGDDSASSDKYLEIISVLEDNAVDGADVAALENAAASAMVSTLNDSWSYYMAPEEYAEYLLAASNEYVGIGITTEYNRKYGYLAVSSVTENSPAALAQIEIGNMITTVNGTDVSAFTPEDLEGYLKTFGENSFRLGLLNAQGGQRTVELTCQVIYSPPVTGRILENSSIGYVRFNNFEVGCSDYLKEVVKTLQKNGATALVLDLRNNPGGQVSELKEALDFFLPKGELFLCRDRNGKDISYSSDSGHVEMPMAVIVNPKTENEAEMFAVVMQSNGAVTVVGQRTSGNGHNQVIIELSDGSAIRVSKYIYLTADRKDLATLGGVVPDVRSSPIADSELDVQLEAAKDAVGR